MSASQNETLVRACRPRRSRHFSGCTVTVPPPVTLAPKPLPKPRAIDLYGKWDTHPWSIRDQIGHPTCVGFVVAACVELMRARKAGMAFDPMSPIFLYRKVREAPWPDPLPPDWVEGATKLSQAGKILASTGICSLALWPWNDPDKEPSKAQVKAAEKDAKSNRIKTRLYKDWGTVDPRRDVALTLYRELAKGYPVAVSLPEYAAVLPRPDDDPEAARKPASWAVWHSALVNSTGEVPDPRTRKAISGHAVCLIGFQPDPKEKLGGYFLFRNSWGADWAEDAPDGPPDRVPFVPAPGYGTISATHVERHASEMLSLDLPAVAP